MTDTRYIVRKAAGAYWLLDISQTGMPYIRPLEMNESGAYILKKYWQGFEEKDIVRLMSEEYDVDASEVEEDVKEFLKKLKQFGVREVK